MASVIIHDNTVGDKEGSYTLKKQRLFRAQTSQLILDPITGACGESPAMVQKGCGVKRRIDWACEQNNMSTSLLAIPLFHTLPTPFPQQR